MRLCFPDKLDRTLTEAALPSMPTYGVVTICLNSAATVRRAVESVFGQTLPPSEYVFVDGGSTDGTLDILEGIVARGSSEHSHVRLALLRQSPGGGIPQAWNMGIAELSADVVFLLNGDDWYEPDCAGIVMQALAGHPEADIAVAPILLHHVGAEGEPVVRPPRSLAFLPVLMPVMHPACFVRRSLYGRVGLFDERFSISADYDFVYRSYRAGTGFVRIGTPVTHMLGGGLASRSRGCARRETLTVGLRHCRNPLLPLAAYGLRAVLGR